MEFCTEKSLLQKPSHSQSLAQHLFKAGLRHDELRLDEIDQAWLNSLNTDGGPSSPFTPSNTPEDLLHEALMLPDLQETAEILCFMASGGTEQDYFSFNPNDLSPESLALEVFTMDFNLEDPLKILSAACSSLQDSTPPLPDLQLDLPELDMDFSAPATPSPEELSLITEDWSFLVQQFDPPTSLEPTTPPSTPNTDTPEMTIDDFDFDLSDMELDMDLDFEMDRYLQEPAASIYKLPLFGEQCQQGQCAEEASWNEMMGLLAAAEQMGDLGYSGDGFYGCDAAEQMLVNGGGWTKEAGGWIEDDMC
ncbi:hypothetical protein EX30DRAFT_338062, partial [Ascodesmis nigricans]